MNKKNSNMTTERSVLVLTNDQSIDQNIGFILKQLGYSYIVANRDYVRVIKLLSSKQIKCILLSLLDKDGIDLAQAIDQAYQVPIIFYTAQFNIQVLQRIKEIPPPVYLTRIYNKDELYVNIELACYNHDFAI